MAQYKRVMWHEGLFLRPHHFQQQQRHVEHLLDIRCAAQGGDNWGFIELELERELLHIGKLGLCRARGVFPDGTAFSMPDEDPLPAPIDITDLGRGQVVYLAVALTRAGVADTERSPAADSMARFGAASITVRDAVGGYDGDAQLEVGELRTRLVLASQPAEGYARIPLASVIERRPDGRVLLEESFMPTVVCVRAAEALHKQLIKIKGLLKQRGDTLASKAVAGGGGFAEIIEFLMLQTVNRFEPVVSQLADAPVVHPADVFLTLAALAGDLATTTLDTRRPPELPSYRHEALEATFAPLIRLLEREFLIEPESRARPIALVVSKRASRGVFPDPAWLDDSMFVLAVRADVATEATRRNFASDCKVSEKDRLPALVQGSLPGIDLQLLPAAPRQIPQIMNTVYFELMRGGALWTELRKTGQLGLWVFDQNQRYPNLTLELWAIRT